jgi:hypothetical protein
MMPSMQRLRDLSGQWNRWADDYDALALRFQSSATARIRCAVWAQVCRNAAAVLALTVLPTRPAKKDDGT